MNAQHIARIRELLDLGFSDQQVAADVAGQREHGRVDSLTDQGEEYAAHGDDRPYAVSQYGPVNDAGERGF